MATANGVVQRDNLLAMAFVNDGNGVAMMNSAVVRCAMNLRMSQNQTRCPGTFLRCAVNPMMSQKQTRGPSMFLRNALFTATAPDGAGVLFVAVKKNGVVRQLPVV